MTRRRLEGLRPETRAILAGRAETLAAGAVNPPIHRASTILVDRVADLYGEDRRTYGLAGVAVHDALSEALCDGRPVAGVTLAPSGLAACALAILAVVEAGADLLVTDSAYGPTRRFCDRLLARFGVATRYFAPRIGADIAELIQSNTKAIVLESPGSLTFELQDVPAIAAIAQARGVVTILDDTWSAGVLYEPFAHGVDLAAHALTKYQAGHSDVLLGAIWARTPELHARVARATRELGAGPGGADDAYLALRGVRTMRLRLAQQGAAALHLAAWLETQPMVARVLHPALPSHPDHALYRRDFTGAAGLFGLVLQPVETGRLNRALEDMAIFRMGFSWGGFESLVIPCDPQVIRTAAPWRAEGPLLRLSIGLEHEDDLQADLAAFLAALS